MKIITCPFCDHEIRTREIARKNADETLPVQVVRCWNCGEAFEPEPEEEEFIFGSESGF